MVPSEVSVVASDFPVLKKLSGAKNMLSGQYYGALVRRFFYRRRIIRPLTNFVFDDLVPFGKIMKFSTKISRSPSHLIKFWASKYPKTVGSPVAHRNQLHGASYFDHYSQLQTPFSMILYYLESLQNFLQEYPGVRLI